MVTDNRIIEVQNRVYKIWLREDGIVQTVVLPGSEYNFGGRKTKFGKYRSSQPRQAASPAGRYKKYQDSAVHSQTGINRI